MPSAVAYYPPTDVRRNQWSSTIISEKTARRNAYRRALNYYLGKQDVQLAIEPDDPDDNTIVNLVQMTADRTVSFLFQEVPEFVIDAATPDETDEETYLRKAIHYNGGLNMLSKLALRGFLAGHTFVRVSMPRWEGQYPTITVLDPTAVTVYWAADNQGDVLWYETRYYVGDVSYVEDCVRTALDVWEISTYKESTRVGANNNFPMSPTPNGSNNAVLLDRMTFGGAGWEQVGTTLRHTSDVPPIIDIPHLPHPDDYYGMSEFTQKDLQDAINRMYSVRNKIVRENAEPVDILIGADPDEVTQGGGITSVPNPAAKVQRLEMKGDLMGIGGTIDKLVEVYLAIARVVLLNGEAKDLQRVTNASVRTLFLDALSKNQILRSSYGKALEKIAHLLLDMGFATNLVKTNPKDLEIVIKFQTPLPVDDLETANINAIGIAGGWMTPRTAAQRMDLDWAFEMEASKGKNSLLTNTTNDVIMSNTTSGETPPKGN